ncbi:TPA: hypothetical protein N0F65_009895 [Lagenidium giganteum]|uniref:Major facilitator superfamily (MFS) profile domain-containing protein n=1 Tax=Lagenidium giganteum TaxID=4803 RepID=A0AAV2YW23_9STRA|nr:TPA: hypothetical protein N0F65_009895 [Lagenidium giganteum]
MMSEKQPLQTTTTSPLGPGGCCRDELWAPKLMYTVFAAGQSAINNYLPVFFQHTAHFSKMQIGLLQTLPSVCALLAPPFWGALADRLQQQRLVHIVCIVTGALLMFSIQFVRSFDTMVLVAVLGNFQTAPCGSMLDHAVLDMLSKVGGEYGKQRLFGAVGYGTGAYVTGLVVGVAGIAWSFNLSLVLSLLTLLVLRSIPAMKRTVDSASSIEAGKAMNKLDAPPSFVAGLRLLLHRVDVIALLFVVFCMGLMFGVLTSFLTLNLYNLSGNNAQIIGVAIMCETSSELPAFFFSHRIIQKLGTVNVLLLSIAGYALRITFYATMTNAWSAIPFEFLHGLTFGIAWAATTQYIYAASPKGFEGTVMGILNAVQNGLGRGAGTLIGGYLYQHHGAQVMWWTTDLGVPLALIGLVVFAFAKNRNDAVAETEELLENAELFSPHFADPQALKSPGFASYDPVS